MKISDVSSRNLSNVKPPSEAEKSERVSTEGSQFVAHDEMDKKTPQNVITEEMLEKSIEQANKTLKQYNRYIERSVHEKTKAIMYVMKDTSTDEVVREFPPKKIQDMIAKMWELAGLFVDEKA